MNTDEKTSTDQKEQRGSVFDCDTQQEIGAGTAPGDSAAGCEGPVGFVYFIESPDAAFLKIGYSGNAVGERFRQIACSLPGLKLLGHIPGTRATEKWLHAKFADSQEQGEWFRLDETLRGFIENLGIIPASQTQRLRRRVGKKVHGINLETSADPVIHVNPTASEMGRIGGPARAKSLSPERRQEIAKTAAAARWSGITPEAREFFREQGSLGGQIGGAARMTKLTPEQRSEIARKGGKNRWKSRFEEVA